MLTALMLFACLSSAPLAVAADLGAAPTPDVTAAQTAAAEQAPVPDPGFATWLAGEIDTAATAPAPAFELAAQCLTCAQCPPSRPFCCILASGCAACTSHPVPCASGASLGT